MSVIVLAVLLAICAGATFDRPSPVTVGCTVFVGSMFAFAVARDSAEWRR